MFSPDDILALSKAGFNAQQIAGLSMIANKQPEPAPAPADPAPTAPAAPAPAAPAPTAPTPENDPILAELQKLTGLMMSQNITNTQQPAIQTPEDILAEIINPAPPKT